MSANSANRFDELVDVNGVSAGSIAFPFESNKLLQAQIQLRNKSSRNTIAYKIKTTNPKRYSVLPSQSSIAPGGEANIEITMQPYNLGDNGSLQVADKFQIIIAEMSDLQPDEDISTALSIRQDGNKRLGVILLQKQQSSIPNPNINLSDATRQQQQQALITQQPSSSSSRGDLSASQKLYVSANNQLNPSQEEEKRLGEALTKQKNENNLLQQQNKDLEKKIKELQKIADTGANPDSNFTLLQVFFIAIVGIVLGAFLSR